MLFDVKEFSENNIKITVLDIPNITIKLKQFIDENIHQICLGEEGELEVVKLDLKERIEGWGDRNKIIGSIAEFFVHLYLKHCGYQQECLFFNLEERSLKKGFDGLYSIGKDLWFMESKSGLQTTRGVTHASKIREAYDDVKKKITTGVGNNPWLNAYQHARVIRTDINLRKNLKRLSDDFLGGHYQSIDDKNIIPCATIFLNGIWSPQNHKEIIQSVKRISSLNGKKIHILCITQKSCDMFMQYLGANNE